MNHIHPVAQFILFTVATILIVVTGLLLAPILGWILLIADFVYRKRTGRSLIQISNFSDVLPEWVAREAKRRKIIPRCLQTFDLELPCSQEQLLEAYREKAKEVHPDTGGSRQEFLRIQRDFEEARSLISNSQIPL